MKKTITLKLILVLILIAGVANAVAANQAPVADAGLSRYTAQDMIALNGTGSFDPDESGPLSYAWRQIDGPSVVIIDANTATPTIGGSLQTEGNHVPTVSGFIQTEAIQVCEFELVVSDGELVSMSDTVKVIIVPDFGARTLLLENPPFDHNKPTLIYFGGGNCVTGGGAWAAPLGPKKQI